MERFCPSSQARTIKEISLSFAMALRMILLMMVTPVQRKHAKTSIKSKF
jgi:hypothetical protein